MLNKSPQKTLQRKQKEIEDSLFYIIIFKFYYHKCRIELKIRPKVNLENNNQNIFFKHLKAKDKSKRGWLNISIKPK
ncbi:hypothetical protein D0T87_11775 [Bacteroides sp. 51]|nr:hypothetical protein [Bacteroides sp. 51]